MLKLTEVALKAIQETKIKLKLALALDCSENTINRYIKQNDDNLTKAAALDVIRRETGLKDEELLEERKTN